MKRKLSWKREETPEDIAAALTVLGEVYEIAPDAKDGRPIHFEQTPFLPKLACEVDTTGHGVVVRYKTLTGALRGLGRVMAGVKGSVVENEKTSFETFGIMLDCSRNAVMNVQHLKQWLEQLALLGYNMVMLYTEDTYQLAGEPYFGYQRGAYSLEELQEIDAYAAVLGIEMIGCIQTLGHLGQILRWPPYNAVRDTSSVLLVGEEKTYALIEKMIAHFKKAFRSTRIHVGMDETHDLGRGRFMDIHGYERGFDIFNRHLAQVVHLCGKHGLKPMIWSDMYFRMGSKTGDYYDKECVIPKDVSAKIPRSAQLVYWDYYHQDEAFYADWIKLHRDLGFEPLMASGVWTWSMLWQDSVITARTALPCLAACQEAKLKEFFFTLWGDDGAYCDFDSAFIGLSRMAEAAYCPQVDVDLLMQRFTGICGADYAVWDLATQLNIHAKKKDGSELLLLGAAALWDDPLLGLYWHELELQESGVWTMAQKHYENVAGVIEKHVEKEGDPDVYHASRLAAALHGKVAWRNAFLQAYQAKDKKALEAVKDDIEPLVELIDSLDESFRAMWMAHNKPQGLEAIQMRLAFLARRYWEAHNRIEELLEGEIEVIGEMENLPAVPLGGISSTFLSLASGSASV